VTRRVRRVGLAALLVATAGLGTGCGDDGAEPVNFNAFVKAQLLTQSETAEPVDVNALVFQAAPGDDDPAAFDDVLGVDSGG
jgi:hypothetical protein